MWIYLGFLPLILREYFGIKDVRANDRVEVKHKCEAKKGVLIN